MTSVTDPTPSSSGSLSSEKRSVVIIGGGLAGLAAAGELLATPGHFDVTLLEAKRTMGGRAGSFSDPATGNAVDYCQHVAMGCCTNFLGLLDRYGLKDRMKCYSSLTFLHPDHPPSRFAPSSWMPAPLHLAGAIGSLRYLTTKQKWHVRWGIWQMMRSDSNQMEGQVAATWLASHGQDKETIAAFWDVVLVSALGERTDRVSMLAAHKVFMDGFAAARGASDVWVPTRPLSELIGRDLAGAIGEQGSAMIHGCCVNRILPPTNQQSPQVVAADGRAFGASDVIVAVPWFRIESLLADSPIAESTSSQSQWTAIPASPITGIHLWFDRPITTLPHAVMVGTKSQWLFREPLERTDTTDSASSTQPTHYYQVVISASHDLGDQSREALVAEVITELRHAFDGARSAVLIASRVVTDPRSVFSVRPEVEKARPPARTALPWLHLAGDWTSTGWPATMEGAVISGILAASNVMQRYGLPAGEVDGGLKRGWLARRMIRRSTQLPRR
ncbi:15-cis-phytoene desaturase [Rubripirellula tenax]|uniref:15-cis-phytoene desaturase n=1 Tax=Rubripirellula tenax TaxID=2528015 RepID=A0A5C6FG55_9BACT|nr:hydroxysqualene dehydroxylase HpnE [Rubripirellula tenax]TWU59480.1 15-cis-phytoene desaturase [Rubripirellula tenax]